MASQFRFLMLLCALPLAASLLLTPARAAEPSQPPEEKKNIVNVYSYRQPFLIEPLFKAFQKKTGITVNVLFAQKGLIERIAIEGRTSPADLLLTTDVGQMLQAAESISAAAPSRILMRNIPPKYRAPNNKWFALTKRVRALFVKKNESDFDDVSYEKLGQSNLGGTICMRNGQHAYNIGLISSYIAHYGAEKTKTWLEGLKQNLARRPAGNDRLQVKGVYAGECDIAIANTYYMGKMLTNNNSPEQKEWADVVQIVFPRFETEDGGTHVNFSGMVLMRFAQHRENALALMEFLSSAPAQKIYAADNFEFPVNPQVEASPVVSRWGIPLEDALPIRKIVAFRGEASLLVDEVGLND